MPAMMRFIVCLLLILSAAGTSRAQAPRSETSETGDVLAPVMAGEFALQAGRLEEASQWYLQAAQDSDDIGLAELSTRIALLAEDDQRARQSLDLWRKRAPTSLAMQAAEATLAVRGGNTRVALRELKALLRAETPQAWRYAISALGAGGRNPDTSAKVTERLIAGGHLPNQLPFWLALGGLAQSLDRPALSERVIAEVVRRFPADPRVALLHATQLRRSGQAAQAKQVLSTLTPAAAQDPQLRVLLAQEFDALGDPVAAAGAMAQGPQDERTWALRASLLAKAEDNFALTALYDELRGASGEADAGRDLLLGQIAQYLKRPAEALEWYTKISQGEARTEARLRAAYALHELDRKSEAYEQARKMQGDASLDDDARRNAYLLEAELRQKDEDEAGEIDALARGLAAYPDDSALLYARGLAWEKRDQIDRAEADLRRILVTEPDNTAVLNALGYTLADRTTRYQEALQLIDRARAASPDEGAIIDSYGWVLYRLGKVEEALAQLRRAFTLMKDPEIAAHLGQVLWEQGRREEARRYFEEARKLDPDSRALQRALEKTGA
ncbi:tetratricopeptide repeat protein [Pseudoxanthomonas composti]|uniref:Tetratricopeptide repeat protein n=1 Tax=Pseudoxanthomonas composti TaxID=2137479 RepID=A0A4Q1JTT7_9GAMM|nr:tetratricopeptide repeat protein [Pseudoxanthomonas composti]RXR04416.1 tetratricopeptide repeat protein [Pseudoxanthomonas composti]